MIKKENERFLLLHLGIKCHKCENNSSTFQLHAHTHTHFLWLYALLLFSHGYEQKKLFSGYKMSLPVCRNRLTGGDVEESLCNHASRPEPTVVQCNTHACPPK